MSEHLPILNLRQASFELLSLITRVEALKTIQLLVPKLNENSLECRQFSDHLNQAKELVDETGPELDLYFSDPMDQSDWEVRVHPEITSSLIAANHDLVAARRLFTQITNHKLEEKSHSNPANNRPGWSGFTPARFS